MELWTGVLSLVKMPLARFEKCWPLLMEYLPELPLKPEHSNTNPNLNRLANQLWSIDFLTPPTPLIVPHRLPAFLESLITTQKLMFDSCKMVEKQSEAFHAFLWHFPSLKQ